MVAPEELFRIGLALLKSRQYQQAADLAAQAVLDFPDDGRLWELLGVARHHCQEHTAAVAALETASLCRPLDGGARFCLAGSYAATGARELAVFVYRLVAADEITPAWLLPRIAASLGQLHEHAEALAVCRELIRRDPTKHEAHFGVAFYLRRMGVPTVCVAAAALRAHELAPQSALYRIALASLWQELGRTDDAYDLLHSLPPEEVRCPKSLWRMMAVFRAAGDGERFEACARRARSLNRRSTPDGDY